MSLDHRHGSSGVVTFLFTDIEGSTKRWQRFPEAMKPAVARHDAILRSAIAENGGKVFKTIGDAFCAAFPTPSGALLAAVDAQRLLAAEEWGEVGPIRARMALHSGSDRRTGNEYVGPDFNRAARLLATGHGGQILVSTATRALLRGEELPGDTEFRDLGEHRLKDLARPERIYQCLAHGAPAVHTKLKSQPSPWFGLAGAVLLGACGIGQFSIRNRPSDQSIAASLTPAGIYAGLKSLAIDLSTYNEWLLLGLSIVAALACLCVFFARRRRAGLELRLKAGELNRATSALLNQRTAAFSGAVALIALAAWSYQQYLWNVALPIPDNAVGFALTREASAATIQDGLADALFVQGQAEQVVVRELPVRMSSDDSERARQLANRIGAEATIIYRVESDANGSETYVAYLVFTDPSVGLIVQGEKSDPTADPLTQAGQQTAPRIKDGVDVPLIRTDSLTELIDSAAGILAYNDDRTRQAIEHLELARPADSSAPNTGIVNYYLGNAYAADFRDSEAMSSYQIAVDYYETARQSDSGLSAQDTLLYIKSCISASRFAQDAGDWTGALSWLARGAALREELLAQQDSLERPGEARAALALLYGEMSNVYRFQGDSINEQTWAEKAQGELDALAESAAPDDAKTRVQEASVRYAFGDCAGAIAASEAAIRIDPDNTNARFNIASVATFTGRRDLALEQWEAILALKPDDVGARQQLANGWVLTAVSVDRGYVDLEYLVRAEQHLRDILALDPTNLEAHRGLASIWEWRALAATMDMTAAISLDDISLAQSQALWRQDSQRRETALHAHGEAIFEWRILASELRPSDPETAIGIADAYNKRHSFLYMPLYEMQLKGDTDTLSDNGTRMLADGRDVRDWTSRVLAERSGATRLQRLQATEILLGVLEREWSWYSFYAFKSDQAGVAAQEFGGAVKAAEALVNAAPPRIPAELDAMSGIVYEAFYYYSLISPDETKSGELMVSFQELSTADLEQSVNETLHLYSTCAEERERIEGDDLLAAGDYASAAAHYEAALAINPAHLPSLNNLGVALYEQGDVAGAVRVTTDLVTTSPGDVRGWGNLAVYHLVSGDAAASDAAFADYATAVNALPSQARLAATRDFVSELRDLPHRYPDRAPMVLSLLNKVIVELAATPPPQADSFEHAAVLSLAAEALLLAGDAAAAESLARQAVTLDPRHPAAHAVLVLAALDQGRDATLELESFTANVRDPFWSDSAFVEPAALLVISADIVDRFSARFPDRVVSIAPFLSVVESEASRLRQAE